MWRSVLSLCLYGDLDQGWARETQQLTNNARHTSWSVLTMVQLQCPFRSVVGSSERVTFPSGECQNVILLLRRFEEEFRR